MVVWMVMHVLNMFKWISTGVWGPHMTFCFSLQITGGYPGYLPVGTFYRTITGGYPGITTCNWITGGYPRITTCNWGGYPPKTTRNYWWLSWIRKLYNRKRLFPHEWILTDNRLNNRDKERKNKLKKIN